MSLWTSLTTRAKWVTIVCGAVTAALVMFTTLANTLALGEPHWIATRGFTRGEVAAAKSEIKTEIKAGDSQQNAQLTALHSRFVEGELTRSRDRRFELNERIANHRLVVQQNPELVQSARDIINRQVAQLADEVLTLERRIDQLERELSGRRP